MSEEMKEYRRHLVNLKAMAEGDYFKQIALSSLVLLCASLIYFPSLGIYWAISFVSILVSSYSSSLSMDKAIKQVDDETIYKERPGGLYVLMTHALNWIAGASLILGITHLVIMNQ